MFFEGTCQECGEIVEFISSKADRDSPRTHSGEDPNSECTGDLKRVPFPRRFAVKWRYSPGGKATFLGPTNNVYKTDNTIKRDVRNTRTVNGPSYKGPKTKEREW